MGGDVEGAVGDAGVDELERGCLGCEDRVCGEGEEEEECCEVGWWRHRGLELRGDASRLAL